MSKQEITITVDLPDGWEATGEFRNPAEGEAFISSSGELVPFSNTGFSCSPRLILRRVEPKKESRWINIYSPTNADIGLPRESIAECNHARANTVVGTIRVDYENDTPVSVTLEPLTTEQSQ